MAYGKKTGGRKAGTPNKSTAALKAIAPEYSRRAFEKLCWLMDNAENEATQLAACKEILDRAHGRPPAGHVLHDLAGEDSGLHHEVTITLVSPDGRRSPLINGPHATSSAINR